MNVHGIYKDMQCAHLQELINRLVFCGWSGYQFLLHLSTTVSLAILVLILFLLFKLHVNILIYFYSHLYFQETIIPSKDFFLKFEV